VEIVDQTKTIGEGIKKTYGYNTPLTRTQLEKWREEFWGNQLYHYRFVCRDEDKWVQTGLGTAQNRMLGR